jgi:3-methyl-2-oxobutanoate hydroxymethyltransferase
VESKVIPRSLVKMKAAGDKISVLTSYDYMSAKLLDEAKVDVALVGDSLGMVVLGYDNTLSVTMEDMLRHSLAVSKAVKRALVVADMPFLSYQISLEEAILNAGKLVKDGGAEAVKLEGGTDTHDLIKRLVSIGIPVMGHIGVTPQSVLSIGYAIQGKEEAKAMQLIEDALSLQDAGCFAIVLEQVVPEVAAKITQQLTVPTIGIGSGPDCDGQVLVMHDILNLYDNFKPQFAKQYADIRLATLNDFAEYNKEVKSGKFPK